MAVTRSKAVERAEIRRLPRERAVWRRAELAWILASALAVSIGLYLVYSAKSQGLAAIEQDLTAKKLLNLNDVSAREDLLPALQTLFPDAAERELAARKIYFVSGSLSNVGAVARIRVTAEDLGTGRGLKNFRDRLGTRESEALLTGDQLREWKPTVVVRRPAQFRRAFFLWAVLFLAAFFVVHAWWGLRGFEGDQSLLPAVLLLTGVGLVLMVSLRDPVRDNMLFVDFAQGVAGGCLLLAALSAVDFERLAGKLSYVPLLASFGLSALLILFGHGPGTSDAKVNLLGFQPVEIIRLLLVFFLAGYFGSRWDVLRHARETRSSLAALTRRFDIPPVEYTLPALVSVALSLVFFFLQKDMGPALIFACLFLTLYGVARGGALVPLAGLSLVVLGFVFGYFAGVPHTVGERVSMWLSPWDNLIHGGDQLAHSLWAFSTGGISGTGIGLGDPQLVPAAHTDLILSALGEEWGFLGVAAVFALFALIVYRALRIAERARTDYESFLAAGLAAATALQILLISGGALGVLPLSGVVTPFLSYGRTAMLANFAVIAILVSISARAPSGPASARAASARAAFGHTGSGNAGAASARDRGLAAGPTSSRTLAVIFALAGAVVLAKAAYVQVVRGAAVVGEGTLVVQADGARRYQYNPRLQLIMAEIPKGTIYDRNGLPLATSDWSLLEQHRADYQALGIDIDRACPRTESRHYPFGGLTLDLLGDLRTRIRWGASNTSYVERDSARRLRGYDDRPTLVDVQNPKTGKTERVIRYDYRELVPLLRYRYDPQNPAVRRVLDRPRDVRMSIDARLQVKVAEILRNQLQQAKQDKGAAVVMDPATGDLLAAVSFPLPVMNPDGPPPDQPADLPFLDRARYGLYPPGSTFKVVTAMAALRKDPSLVHKTYECIRLPDGRVGNFIKGSNRPIRDDIQDQAPHGTVDMQRGIVVSCNAYFAQLGTYDVGAQPLWDTANALGIVTASPNTAAQLKKSLPQSSYGQGQVVASPFQMARVAATVANGGAMPQGRWLTDETNTRTTTAETVLAPDAAQTLAKFMREVVTSGTGRRAAVAGVAVAGKTGTAELADGPSHAWFIGYAPYGPAARRIAFSVLVENGVYGGTAAAPAGAEIVNAALKLGLVQP
ncbi:Penicillin-binding protein, transpeptidase [Candidatus Sulfopaludibacter sp. SbA4]|nr:Penicillin-binding protein, transpeptidase [Candidatus Sulfopaludibacter sp. SbA4]